MDKPTVTREVMLATQEDISRLESSVKELTKAVQDVVLLNERQSVQGKRLGDLETEVGVIINTIAINKDLAATTNAATDKKVESLTNKLYGGWAVLSVLFALAEIAFKH